MRLVTALLLVAAVAAFLEGRIPFTDIVRVVEETMEKIKVVDDPSLDDIFDSDREARVRAGAIIQKRRNG